MNLNLAVLIDGDNIPSAPIKEMMEEIAKYGNPTSRQAGVRRLHLNAI